MSSKNFGHQKCNASNVIKFVSDVMYKNYEFITFISKYHYLRTPRVAFFAEIIKIATMFTNKIFKDSKEGKRIRNYVPECNLYLYSLI